MAEVSVDVQTSFWRGHVQLGVASTAVCAGAGLVYTVATPHGPHRVQLAAIALAALLSCPVILLPAVLRRFTGAGREPWLYAWSGSLLMAVLAASILDGGGGSPLTMLYGASLVFTASGFGRGGAVVMGTSAVGCYLLTCATGSPGVWTMVLTSCALVVMAGTCALTAGRLRASLLAQEALTGQLETRASHDGLTGCLNRTALVDLLEREVIRAQQQSRPLGCVMMDLDDFKRANDTYGHVTGDELLTALGEAVRAAIRPGDVVGRVGGDEFAIVVADADERATKQLADRVRRRLQAVGAPYGVDISVGVAAVRPGDTGRTLRERADEALYVAKRAASLGA